MGTFVVVRDPAWGDGRAGTYYRDAAQAAAAGAAGEWRMWDQERLVAQRVHLVLEVDTSGGSCFTVLLLAAKPVCRRGGVQGEDRRLAQLQVVALPAPRRGGR